MVKNTQISIIGGGFDSNIVLQLENNLVKTSIQFKFQTILPICLMFY